MNIEVISYDEYNDLFLTRVKINETNTIELLFACDHRDHLRDYSIMMLDETQARVVMFDTRDNDTQIERVTFYHAVMCAISRYYYANIECVDALFSTCDACDVSATQH